MGFPWRHHSCPLCPFRLAVRAGQRRSGDQDDRQSPDPRGCGGSRGRRSDYFGILFDRRLTTEHGLKRNHMVKKATVISALILLVSSLEVLAGPPFLTDDPEPVD